MPDIVHHIGKVLRLDNRPIAIRGKILYTCRRKFMDDNETPITWNDSLEILVAEEAEKCGGLSWLHAECERYFSTHANWIALPVIILSTVNGFLSGSSQTIFSNAEAAAIGLGVVSLFTGVLSTIGSYFAWAKRTEAHRISAIQYQKISKFLTIELSLSKSERVAAKDILKITREQIERLMEISPAVPESIIVKYKNKFKDTVDVAQPEIIHGLKKVRVNKYVEDVKYNSDIKIEFKNNSKAIVNVGKRVAPHAGSID